MTTDATCAICDAAITADNPTNHHLEVCRVHEPVCRTCIELPHDRFLALVGAYQARLFGVDPSAHASPGGDA